MEFRPQQISGLFNFLPWVWARCPGWRGVVQVPQPKVRRGPWESLDKLSLSKRGELVAQVVLLREMRQECSCSLLSDRITHQLHVSLVFMQHVNYRCDPYKLFPEHPINRWRGWLNIAIGLTHQALVLHVQSWFDTSSEINGAFCCLDLVRQRSLNHTFHMVEIRIVYYLKNNHLNNEKEDIDLLSKIETL